MREFLSGIGYNGWVLPALLVLPLVGAALLLAQGLVSRDDGSVERAGSARWKRSKARGRNPGGKPGP